MTFEPDTCAGVLPGGVAGAEAELEAPSLKLGEGGRLARQDHGMAKIVVEHERANAHAFGRFEQNGAGRKRSRHPVREVVGYG